MMARKTLVSGELPSRGGEYRTVGPRGGDQHQDVTVKANKPMPPTEKPNRHYEKK